MKAMLKLFFIIIGATALFAAAPEKDSYDAGVKILKELDIDPSFIKTPYYASMKKGITNGQIRTFTDALKGGYMYIPMIKSNIKTSGIPDSFFYLAMIESGFATHVTSNAKAVGIWQFMEKTARIHGLKIDEYVDERRDPVESTRAAATYLKGLKNKFGKWYLAVFAYNCGDGCVSKAIQKAGTDDLATLIDPNKKFLPPETRNFIVKILRAAYIAKDADALMARESSLININGGLKLTKIEIPGGTNLVQIGDSIGLSVKKMKSNNPHLKFVFTPPNTKNYYVYIPENKKELFTENFKPVIAKNNFYTYVVKKGDTLFSIAKQTGISHRAIKDYNELTANYVAYNQKLIIPASKSNETQNYVVQAGDTLASVSKKFNVKAKDIKEANSLANSNLSVGANIVIP